MYFKKFASIMLVIGMFFAGAFFNNMEIIFPEISALAIGAWVMEKSPWQGRKLNLWLSPTLAAFTGMFLLKFFPYHPFFMIAAALVLVLLELKLLRSHVFPAIPAAILPIIVHANSWLYPVAVCVLTGIILCGKAVFEQNVKPAQGAYFSPPPAQDIQPLETFGSLVYWVKIALPVLLVTALAVGFNSLYILAPPLIVVFIELTKSGGLSFRKYFKALLLIACAAFSGVAWLLLTVNVLNLPLWILAVWLCYGYLSCTAGLVLRCLLQGV